MITLHALGDREAVSARLRQNSNEITSAFDVFYSSVGAGAQLSSFLDAEQNLFQSALNAAISGGDLGATQGRGRTP